MERDVERRKVEDDECRGRGESMKSLAIYAGQESWGAQLERWGRQERQKQGAGAQSWHEREGVLAASGQVELGRIV